MSWRAAIVLGALVVPGLAANHAADLQGRVLFVGLGVPGATITATLGDRTVDTTSSDAGGFHLTGLEDGTWRVRVEMRGFVTVERDVTVPFPEGPLDIALTMRPYGDIVEPTGAGAQTPAAPTAPPESTADDAAVIHGTVTNGAATPFAQSRAMGNNRPSLGRLYTGSLTTALADSAWNARPYSFGTSGTAARADTGDVQLSFSLRGPFRIPGIIRQGPTMVLSGQHGVGSNAITQSAIMPTPAERLGDFSQSGIEIRDPRTGLPFAGNVMPPDRIAPQATALLAYYPQPNSSASAGANFERPVVTTTRQTSGRFQMDVAVSRLDRLGWDLSGRHTVTDTNNLFDFTNRRRQTAVDAGVNWTRTLSPRLQFRLAYQFTRVAGALTPFFADRINVSGDAGIAGNDQQPVNWGPPTLLFPTIADLRDGSHEQSATITHGVSGSVNWRRGRHSFNAGGGMRPTTFTMTSQPDPRGTLSFTGAATGEGLADFLLGLPTTSALAVTDTGTGLRGAAYDAYVMGDFRLAPGLTLNAGVRWEYETPFTERSGRLVNLDVAQGFTAVSPVLATEPVGALSGRMFPASLLRPDKWGIQPRVGLSWRPNLTSSLVIRGGYGVYRNLGTYQSLAQLLAQQPPFSRAFNLQSGAETPLTLANPFPASTPTNTHTVGIDLDFRPASVHSWQIAAQRDFPASMTVSVGYFGDRGVHLVQAFLPNTEPGGAVESCSGCPSGFVYVTSTGTSGRHAMELTVRRRLRNGFTAGVQYTLSKATDDAATFNNRSISPASLVIAQDWRDLGAERGPSSFDQRHRVSVEVQYATGMGLTGGSLARSLKGSLLRNWTIATQLDAGSGMPFTPVLFRVVGGTGFVGVRPRLTGVSAAPTSPGSYANADAYAEPLPGTWGDAGRHSIRGPSRFSLNLAISRSFQFPNRLRLEWRINATNVLNRVTFSAINTTVTSPQFGRPTRADAMRRITTSIRFGF